MDQMKEEKSEFRRKQIQTGQRVLLSAFHCFNCYTMNYGQWSTVDCYIFKINEEKEDIIYIFCFLYCTENVPDCESCDPFHP